MCKTVPEGQQSPAFVFVVREGTAYGDFICCESLDGGFSHSSLGIASLSLNTLYKKVWYYCVCPQPLLNIVSNFSYNFMNVE